MCEHVSEPIKTCINIPPNLSPEAHQLAIKENPDNAVPAFDRQPRSAEEIESLRLALIIAKKWKPGRTLRVRFLGGDPVVHQKIEYYAKQWEQYANIKLEFGSDPNAEIRISLRLGEGSWSYLGTDALTIDKDQPTMNYGWLTPSSSEEEYSRVVLHEFGHALGCIHEHQHPEAGIPWDREAVYSYYMGPPNNWTKEQVDNNIFRTLDRDSTQFSQFDTQSIMIYSIPNQLTIGDFEVGWNKHLSETDKQFIRQAYPLTQGLTGIFQITSKHSGKCIDLSLADGPDTVNGSNIHQWDWHDGDNQRWILIALDDGSYQIQSKYSGKCIDLSLADGPDTVNGSNIHQWDCHDGDNQRWILIALDDGSYQIQSKYSGKCIDLSLADGPDTVNGSNIHQWDWHGGDNQRWILTPSS
jgi:serralysin